MQIWLQSETISLNYTYSGIATYSNNDYQSATLSVSVVSQLPYSNICWAASVACIGNYLTSSSYTAVDVAKTVYGTNFNQTASAETALGALKNIYGVGYTYHVSVPSDDTIYNNLSKGYPIYSLWSYSSGNHATVIRGVLTNSYVMVMDPEFGFTTAWKNSGVYSYVSGYSGVTLELFAYGSKY